MEQDLFDNGREYSISIEKREITKLMITCRKEKKKVRRFFVSFEVDEGFVLRRSLKVQSLSEVEGR